MSIPHPRTTDDMLRSIPTEYDGHRFRSRLEARWALFFNFIGIAWEYEREGFAVDGGGFFPDFWLPSLQAWFEVKPEWDAFSEERKLALVEKTNAFLRGGGGRLIISFGSLRSAELIEMESDAASGRDVHWGRCSECIAWDVGVHDVEHRPCGHSSFLIGGEQTRGALLDAHAHRFWEPR